MHYSNLKDTHLLNKLDCSIKRMKNDEMSTDDNVFLDDLKLFCESGTMGNFTEDITIIRELISQVPTAD